MVFERPLGMIMLAGILLSAPACSQDTETAKTDPDAYADAVCPEGMAALEDENGPAAITAINACLSERQHEWHEEAQLRLQLGSAYLAEDRAQDALISFNQVLAIMTDNGVDPNNPFVLRNRAIAYMELERYDDALDDLQVTLSMEPNEPFNHVLLGWIYIETDRPEEAVAAFDRAVRMNPDDPNNLSARSSAFVEMEMFDLAIQDAQEAVSIAPEDAGTLNALCWALVEAGRASEALDICDQAVAADPESGNIIHSKAAALEQVGRLEEAAELYAEAYEREPDSDRIEEDYERSREF